MRKITILALIILGGLFYWYELRPYAVRRVCTVRVIESTKDDAVVEKDDIRFIYDVCLSKNGLKAL